jgi:2-methylcitrate dehydratase PrpD
VDTGTLQDRIAGYVCELSFEQLPREVVTRTKAVLSHDLAVAVAGSRAPESLRALAFALGGVGGAGRCRIIGTREERAPLEAAFANSVMMRALRQEDTALPSFIHPGAVVVPAALAVGEQVDATGADVITAIVAGYDVCTKLAGRDWTWNTSKRTPSHVFGAFAAAVAAAKLLGCDRHQLATAVAYAGNLAAVITNGFDNHQYGVLTRNGMTAAFLGEAGAPAPVDAIESEHGFCQAQLNGVPDDLESRLLGCGVHFEIMTSVLKPHPCTSINLVPTLLLQRMLTEHSIPGRAVRGVTVSRSMDTNGIPGIHDHGPWTNTMRTISSLPFALAAVLLDGVVTPERLHDSGNRHIFELAQRVRIDLLPTTDLLHHVVELTTVDGATITEEADAAILPSPNPLTVLGTAGTDVIGQDKAERLLAAIAELETAPSVRELTRYLVP